jgi:hypothetical protein
LPLPHNGKSGNQAKNTPNPQLILQNERFSMSITNPDILDALLTGTTHMFTLGPGKAAVYYETATRAHMRLPDGTVKHGDWTITPTGYHVSWEGGPNADWQIAKVPGKLAYLNGEGVEIGHVTQIIFGDAENLAQ